MVPSECVEPDDEINFDDIIDPKCHNSGDTWKTDINETLYITFPEIAEKIDFDFRLYRNQHHK